MAGTGIGTLRYYERRRLVLPSRRTRGGYRRYAPALVRRVRFIKRAQRLGFSLEAVADLLRLHATHQTPCAQVRSRAEHKMQELLAEQRELAARQAALRRLTAPCRRQTDLRHCPLLDALFGDADPFEE